VNIPAFYNNAVRRPAALVLVWLALAAIAFHVITGDFFGATIGTDYSYFMPWLLSGYFWFQQNGLSIPWFTPAFCAGIPHFANPQSLYYSIPQLLTIVTDPLTSVAITTWLFAFAGFAGMWLLASLYSRSPVVALFAAFAFAFNGMFLGRMHVGHLSFHAAMLLPLVCYLLLVPRRGARRWLDAVFAGALLAYFIHAGAGVLVPPAGVALMFVLLISKSTLENWLRFGIALLAAVLLALGKLVAVGYLMREFPRDLYSLPGAASLLDSAYMTLRALVWPLDEATIGRLVVNNAFRIEPVELNYAVGVVPFAVIALCGAVTLAKRKYPVPTRTWFVVALLLCLPIALNTFQPTWHPFLKALPYFGTASTLFRWDFIYVMPVILWAVRALAAEPAVAKWLAPMATLAIIPGTFLYGPDHVQPYNPSAIVAAYDRVRSGEDVPRIRQLDESLLDGKRVSTMGSGDALTHGASQIVCNEPLFGYRLESFRFDQVFKGAVFKQRAGAFNFYLPQCLLFPAQNRCEKGDRFPVNRATDLVRFTEYRSIPFRMPVLQHIANWISGFSLLALLVAAGARLWLARASPDIASNA